MNEPLDRDRDRLDADALDRARQLSPLRKTTNARTVEDLVREQLLHFSLDPDSDMGRELGDLVGHLYRANVAVHGLWEHLVEKLGELDRGDRIAWFNAKRFLCFQLAKILDTLQNPLRRNSRLKAASEWC